MSGGPVLGILASSLQRDESDWAQMCCVLLATEQCGVGERILFVGRFPAPRHVGGFVSQMC